MMIWALMGIVCVWSIMPGPVTMLIVNNAWTLNRKAGWLTALGGCVGIGFYALIGMFIGTMMSDNAPWATTIEWLGAGYFAFLGLLYVKQGIHLARNPESSSTDLTSADSRSFFNGLLLTCFNPQLALFYWMMVPQTDFSLELLPPEIVVLSLGIVHFLVRLAWYSVLIILTQPLRGVITKTPMQRGMRLAVGSIFLVMSSQLLGG
jgi:threonine/homoserine/homoserine lactone efflux protein